MMGMDIRIEELDTVVNQSIPCTHGDAVDIRVHGGFHGNPLFGKGLHYPGCPTAQDFPICQVVEIQIGRGKPDIPFLNQIYKAGFFLLGSMVQELLNAVIGFAVLAEMLIPVLLGIALLDLADRFFDVVDMIVDDPLLQIGIPDIGM